MIELKYKFENLKICILENEDDFHFFLEIYLPITSTILLFNKSFSKF